MYNQEGETPQTPFGSSLYHQDTIPKTSSRRSTLLVRPQNQAEPPIENPNNSEEVNKQLRNEYNAIQTLNKTLTSVLKEFEQASSEIQYFSQTLNRTDQLLGLWLSVLERTEDTKSVLEDESWLKSVSLFFNTMYKKEIRDV